MIFVTSGFGNDSSKFEKYVLLISCCLCFFPSLEIQYREDVLSFNLKIVR